MKNQFSGNIPVLVAILLLTVLYWAGVQSVPFQPDEATMIFMSSDLETTLQNVSAVFWTPNPQDSVRQNYRLLDAPMARYLIGLGRALTHLPATSTDWDWSKTWEQNRSSGALPDARLLLVARISVSFLFPLTLFFTYDSGRMIGNRYTGWLALLLVAGNSLVLIHTRRAMAESALLCFTLWFLWLILKFPKSIYLIAIPAGLAFCAKQSSVLLFLAGFVPLFWFRDAMKPIKTSLQNFCAYGVIFITLVFLLNPFLWSDPFHAGIESIQLRSDLVIRQSNTFNQQDSKIVLISPVQKLANAIYQLSIASPAISDVGNYEKETQSSSDAYLGDPFNTLFRGWTWGAISTVLVLFGVLSAGITLARTPKGDQRRRSLVFFLSTSLILFCGTLMVIPLPFQRYMLPLVPFCCLFSAYGIAQVLVSIQKKWDLFPGGQKTDPT
jgi:4-amino-4-deoxy-L-arabinose transferase-like glycosyltransferase